MNKLTEILKKYNPYTKDTVINKFNYSDLSKFNDNLEDSFFYKNLDKGIIYFSDPYYFNDSDEYLFSFNNCDWAKLLPNVDKHKMKQEMEKLKKINNDAKHLFGVYCLAKKPNENRFWDGKELGYVQNYNGVCCEYDVESILSNDKTIMFKSIIYNDSKLPYKPSYVKGGNNSKLPDFIKNKLGTEIDEYKKACILSMNLKPTKWSSEEEQRMFIIHKNENGEILCQREVDAIPTKVFIGRNVSKSNVSKIIKLCKEKKIEAYLMRNDTLEFDLVHTD